MKTHLFAAQRDDTLIERVARAICQVRHRCDPETPLPIEETNANGPPVWICYILDAEAAIDVILPEPAE